MSDNWLIVIPADPLLLPSEARCEAAFDRLCALRPTAEDSELSLTETPEFVDCGANFENIFCPFCAADILGAWHGLMERWRNGDRRDLAITTPCCRRATALNGLDYQAEQGFACIRMELMNPEGDLEPSEREEIEAVLGTPVRVIWRHI